MRQLLIFVLSALVFLGAFIGALASTSHRDFMLRGYVNPARSIDVPYRIPRLGVNVELRQYTGAELRDNLDAIHSLDVTWVRQYVYWDEIEPLPGEYNWDEWDTIIRAISGYETLEFIPVFMNSPSWSRPQTDANNSTAPPSNLEAFEEFVSTFVQRYGDVVDYYQIWDEPNIRLAWGNRDPRPAEYVGLLSVASVAVRENDPTAYIIAAALAPTTETGPTNRSDINYLEDLYTLNAETYVDAFAAKPYGFDSSPLEREAGSQYLNLSRIVRLREVMVRNGDAHSHLWASNWGWNTLPSEWSGEESIWGQVTFEEQSTFTLEALERAAQEWPWLGGMILHHWQPASPANDAGWGFALMDQANEPTPLLNALRMSQEGNSTVDPALGKFPASSSAITYSGAWAFGDLGADIGWLQDSGLQIDFYGEEIALLVREGDYVTQLYVEINGKPANALPQDQDGNAFLQLKSDTLSPTERLVLVAENLGETHHTLTLTADELVPDEPGFRWQMMGFAVSSSELSTPYDRHVAIAWGVVVMAGFATIYTATRLPWLHAESQLRRQLSNLSVVWHIVLASVSSLALLAGMLITWSTASPTILKRDNINILLSLLTAGLLYINEFGVIVAALAMLGLFILIYHRLETGLVLIVFWVPFFLFPVELYQFAFPIAEIILFITFSAWLLRSLIEWAKVRQTSITTYRQVARRNTLHHVDMLVAMLLVLGVIALLFSSRTGVAATEFRTLFLQPTLFYTMLRSISPDKRLVIQLIGALILSALFVSIIGIIMFFQGSVIEAEDGARRLVSVYGSPNNVGLLLGRAIPILLAGAILLKDTYRNAFVLFLLLLSVALILTQSAGSLFVGVPGAVIVVLLLCFRRRAMLPIVGVLAMLMMGAILASQLPRFERLTDFTQGTNFYRLRVWESSLEMLEDHSVFGIGLDQFLYEYRGTYILPDAWEEPELSHPHNVLLDFWLRLGIPGVFWLFTAIVVLSRTGLRVYQRFWHGDKLLLAVSIGIVGSLTNFLLHGLVDNSIFVLDQAYIFLLLLALLVTIANTSAIDDVK